MFKLHHSSYRYWSQSCAKVTVHQLKAKADVRSIFNESKGYAGARSFSDITLARGERISRYRVTKIMKKLDLHR
ncbi:MAG: IS3 family transposase [Psychromonas sp.]|nr:IS3 family transposase [Psychromonas sp.]